MLLSINNFPKFRSYSFFFLFFLNENVQKGKNWISFLWDKPLFVLCKNTAHTIRSGYLYKTTSILYYTIMQRCHFLLWLLMIHRV